MGRMGSKVGISLERQVHNIMNPYPTLLFLWHKKQRLVEMVVIGGRQKGKK
jgi:hypothetical protein